MTDDYKVSVITVCLNSMDTIEQTICSVLGQSYPNIEYIIIDGGSTDGTQSIINKYIDKISYYCSQKDNGIYNAMNKGIKKATGDIIGIINSDDWYIENAVELAVKTIKDNQCQMVYGDLQIIYANGRSRIQKARRLDDIYVEMVVNHPTVFATKDIYKEYGCFDENYRSASDYDLILRWYVNNIKMYYIPEIMACFRKGGFSETDFLISTQETYEISKKYIDAYVNKDKEHYLSYAKSRKESNEKIGLTINIIKNLTKNDKQKLKDKITENKDVIVFGTGVYGLWCYDILLELKVNMIAWIDNDIAKQGKDILGVPVLSKEQINIDRQRVIISTKIYEKEIINQLSAMGINDDNYITFSQIEDILESLK